MITYKIIIFLEKVFCFLCKKQLVVLMKQNGFVNPEKLTVTQLHRFFFYDYNDTGGIVH